MSFIRLQKYMADCGVASRRKSEDLIKQGVVKVNGETIRELGTKIDPEEDNVTVNNKEIAIKDDYLFYMFNKPAGYVTTTSNHLGQENIYECFPELKGKVFPVGRLDMDTEGLLLLTNHGELAFRLTHPKYNIKKTYIARVEGIITPKALKALSEGVMLDDGRTAPAQARFLNKRGKNSTVELIIHEGKKRQVRRMLAAVGFPVIQLTRVAIDQVKLAHVDIGQVRPLTDNELGRLFDRVQLSRGDYLNKRI